MTETELDFDLLLNLISWVSLVAGVLLAVIGTIGIIRLPDVFSRMHGAGIVDTGGVGLILLGLMIQAGPTLVTVKLILICAFVLFTSPTTTHAVARAALNGGVKPLVDTEMKREKSDARKKSEDSKSSTT